MSEPKQPRSIDVAMPVHKDPGTLREAVACMQGQSIGTSRNWRLGIWLVCNGADAATRATAAGLASNDPRITVRHLEQPGLAAALNLILRESNATYIARMDADDWCPPDRLERQLAMLESRPDAAACFSAWETRDASESVVQRFAAVEDARLAPWLLLLSNPFAHGSAVLRRRAVLDEGGYDEAFQRAQDYDLWLRLSRSCALVSCVETLYAHRIRHAGQGTEAARTQAAFAARARSEAMARLPTLEHVFGDVAVGARARLHTLMADVAMGGSVADDANALVRAIIEATGPTPTREAVDALLWARSQTRARSDEADRACLRACLREACAQIIARGHRRIALWGAGRHTIRVLAEWTQLGTPTPEVSTIVDDFSAGTMVGSMRVAHPSTLQPGDAVLISSDAHEAAIWAHAEPMRAKGVHVYRLYATR